MSKAMTVFPSIATAMQAATAAGGGLQGVLAGLGTFISAHPVGTAITLGVTAVATGIGLYKKHLEDVRQAAEEASSDWNSQNTSLQDNISRIEELRTALDNGTLSEEDAYAAKSELLSIQQQLTQSYGEQVSGISLVNGELQEQLGLLNQLSQSEANSFLNENADAIATAEKELTKTLGGDGTFFTEAGKVLGLFYDNQSEESEKIKELVNKYSDNLQLDDMQDGTLRIRFVGDASEATTVLNDFMTDLRAAKDEIGDGFYIDQLFDNAGTVIDEGNQIIEKYQSIYDAAQQARLVADTNVFSYDGTEGTAAKWLDNYASAIEKYNEALISGDTKKITEAAAEFNAVDAAIQSLLANSGMSEYSDAFSEVSDQLDTAAIAFNNFQNALEGVSLDDQNKIINDFAQTIKDAQIDDVDFMAGIMNPDDSTALGSAISGLNWQAEQAGISTENLVSMLLDLGIVSGQAASEIDSNTETIVKSFNEMMNAVVEDDDEDSFAVKISDYTSKMEKLTDAKTKLNKTGGKLDTSDMKELLEGVPDLSNYMDDLEGGIDSLITTANNDVLDYFADQIQALRDAGMDADASALEAYAESVINSANEIEGAFIKIGGLKIATPNLSAWEDAGEDAGDAYEKILSGYEAAKEAYENDEVGTSAFKTFAKMISPTGSDDAANFSENMAKFERYFQDGSDGCLNFLQDLEALNLAEENNGKWTYKLGNSMDELKSTAEQLGIGFEPMMAIFGKLEDYGFHNDFFTTEEDGTQHITELYEELASEKRHLAEIEANPNTEGYDTAVQASKDKIAEYEERIQQCNEAIEEMSARAPEEIAARAEYAKSIAQDLQEQISNTDDEQLKNALQQQLDEFAQENNLVIDVETGDITSLEEAISNIDGIEIDLNAKGNDLDSQIDILSSKLQELHDGDALNLDTEQISSIEAVLSVLVDRKHELEAPAVMNISTEQLANVDTQLSNAITAVQNFQTAYNELEKAKSLGLDTTEAQANVDAAKEALNEIDDETKKTLNFDIEGLDDVGILEEISNMDLSAFNGINKLSYEFNITNKDVLDEVVEKIKELPSGTQNVSIQISTENFSKDELQNLYDTIRNFSSLAPECSIKLNGVPAANSDLQAIDNMLGELDGSNANPTVTADNSDAESKINHTTNGLNAIPDADPNIFAHDNASSTISSVSSQLSQLNGKTATTYINTVHTSSGNGSVNGNAHAHGTPIIKSAKFNDGYVGTLYSRSSGSWGEDRDNDALTGELGRELIVRGNRFFTVGDNGPEIVHLKKGDIIFNHKQTADILSKGYTTGRGKALAEGNARVGGGTLGGNKYTLGGATKTPSSQKNTTPTTKKTSSKKNSDSKDDSIDWIEKAIDRIERKIEKLKSAAENIYKTFTSRNKSLKKEISAVSSEIDLQKKAYKRYISEANSVNLSSNLKKKVRNGTIDINKYGEDTKKKIDEYAKWYEKALDCKDAINELNTALTELYRQQFDNIVTKWTNAVQKLEHTAERQESLISRRSDYASDYVTPNNKETASKNNIASYQVLVKNAQDQITKKASELVELRQKLNEAVKNSATTGIYKGSEGYYEMLAEIQSVENEIDSLNSDIISYSNSISEEYMNLFDNIAQGYENKLDLANHLAEEYNNALELAEAKGYMVTEEYYNMLKQVTRDNISTMKQEQSALSNALYAALASGEIQKGSQAWYDMTQQINEVTEAIQQAEIEVQEFNNSIREAKWEQFDYLQERISKVTDEAEFLIDLMSNSDLFNGKGKITDEGLATLGMHGLSYNTLMKQADDYATEIKKINTELANDPYNTNIIERKEELLELQRQSILAAEDEKEAIRNLVSDGIDKELSSLKELINKYNDALDSQKDLYDYQKKVSDQTQNIASLQKQLSAYQNDVSEETRAKIQKIKVELESAKDDLEETQYDHYISDQKKLLDDLYDDYEKALNERLDDLDSLVAEVITTVNANAANIDNTLQQASKDVGYTMTETMSSIWGQATESINAQAAQRVQDTSNILSTLVNNGVISQENAQAIITALGNGTAQGVQNTLDLLQRMGENGVMSEADVKLLTDALNASATPTVNTLTTYSEDFKTQSTAANTALNNISTYVDELKKKAADEAADAKAKAEAEAAAKKAAEDAAAKKAAANQANTKPAAQEATKNTVTSEAKKEADKSPNKQTPSTTPQKKETTSKTKAKTLKVGDQVTFKSGIYYNSSDGQSPTGYHNRGKKVYITKINNASWATKPYHISTGKKLGSGDLGWLTKSQLSYAKGAKRITEDQLGWTNENWQNAGAETIIRKSDGAILTPLSKDSRIYNAMASENMWQAANNPAEYIRKNSDGIGVSVSNVPATHGTTQINMGDNTFSITLPNVKNYEEFKAAMQKDKTFEKFIQSITIDPMAGKSRNGKNRFNF